MQVEVSVRSTWAAAVHCQLLSWGCGSEMNVMSWEMFSKELLDAAAEVVLSPGQPQLDIEVELGWLLACSPRHKTCFKKERTQGRRGTIHHRKLRGHHQGCELNVWPPLGGKGDGVQLWELLRLF